MKKIIIILEIIFLSQYSRCDPLNLTNGLNASLTCSDALQRYVEGIHNGELWAQQMMDASAKPEAGLLNGNMGNFGEFEECLSTEVTYSSELIYGKYCLAVSVNLNQFYLQPVCFPNVCSAQEFQKFNTEMGTNAIILEEFCYTKFSKPKMDVPAYATIAALSIIVLLSVFSTIYDLCLINKKTNLCSDIVLQFSMLRNWRRLLATNTDPHHISCMHGIRSLSLMWILLGHKYGLYAFFPLTNRKEFIDTVIFDRAAMIANNTYLAVDTFLVLSGTLLTYTYFSALSKGVNINWIVFYVHRYIRVTPLLAVIIVIHLTLVKYVAFNPVWMYMEKMFFREPCEKYWWSALLHVQNFVNPNKMCVGPSWFLSVDMQLYLVSPLLLICLTKRRKCGYLLISLMVICCVFTSMITTWVYKLHMILVSELRGFNGFESMNNFSKYYFYTTYSRATPWLVGVSSGFLLYKTKTEPELPKIFNKAIIRGLTVIILAIMLTCIFSGSNLQIEYNQMGTAINFGLRPLAWAIAIGWLIFACARGYAGPINWFLSLRVFHILSKLTFSMFLSHYVLVFAIQCGFHYNHVRFSNFNMLYSFCGDYMFTVAVSFLLALFIEFPIASIEGLIFFRKPVIEKNDSKEEVEV